MEKMQSAREAPVEMRFAGFAVREDPRRGVRFGRHSRHIGLEEQRM